MEATTAELGMAASRFRERERKMTHMDHLIWLYRFMAERLGADEARQFFSGAKASLNGQSSLSPELRAKLLLDYEQAEKVLFPSGTLP